MPINVVTVSNSASVGADENRSITRTSGASIVRATNSTDGIAKATGTSMKDDASANALGAAVGFDYSHVDNLATVGANASPAGVGVTVEAVTPVGSTNDFIAWGLAASGAHESDVSVSASVGVDLPESY